MPLILGAQSAAADAAIVTNSCRFNTSDSAVLTKTIGAGNRKTWTMSLWLKRVSNNTEYASFSSWTGTSYSRLRFNPDVLGWNDVVSGSSTMTFATSAKYRDPSAWYHFVLAVDTTQVTDTDRMKFYVNGVAQTFASQTYPTQDVDTNMNTTGQTFTVGSDKDESYFDGYIAEAVFIDGLALAATSFGEFDSDSPTIWKPIAVSGLTPGTNGFYLDFEDSANLGNDAFGGTDFTENNIVAADQSQDTPVNNFATWNSLIMPRATGQSVKYENGNTVAIGDDAGYTVNTLSTQGMIGGKWYAEIKIIDVGGANTAVGLHNGPMPSGGLIADGDYTMYALNGNKGSYSGGASYGDSWTTGDILSMAFDGDNGTLWWAKDGVWQNSATAAEIAAGTTTNSAITGMSMADFWFMTCFGYGDATFALNTGNGCFADTVVTSSNPDDNDYGLFEYAPPSGYLALCTKNIGSDGG